MRTFLLSRRSTTHHALGHSEQHLLTTNVGYKELNEVKIMSMSRCQLPMEKHLLQYWSTFGLMLSSRMRFLD